jgi:hypothetical protein
VPIARLWIDLRPACQNTREQNYISSIGSHEWSYFNIYIKNNEK